MYEIYVLDQVGPRDPLKKKKRHIRLRILAVLWGGKQIGSMQLLVVVGSDHWTRMSCRAEGSWKSHDSLISTLALHSHFTFCTIISSLKEEKKRHVYN